MGRITNRAAYWMGRHWIWTAVLLVCAVGSVGYISRQVKPPKATGSTSPIERTVKPAPAPPVQGRSQDATDESALIGAIELRRSMRNPDSFKLVGVLVMDGGAVCYTYRAQNGFGGMNLGSAVLSSAGSFKTNEMPGFSVLWNRECANKTGQDETWMIKHNMKALRGIE
jgi:hypothetical protein